MKNLILVLLCMCFSLFSSAQKKKTFIYDRVFSENLDDSKIECIEEFGAIELTDSTVMISNQTYWTDGKTIKKNDIRSREFIKLSTAEKVKIHTSYERRELRAVTITAGNRRFYYTNSRF